jgi:mRNA-degrading endonuclease RelE of RelBE toxin-antitoxin system
LGYGFRDAKDRRMARVRGSSNRPDDNSADSTTGLVFSPDARRQLLKLRAFDQRRLVDAIREHLVQADPCAQTRNKFLLEPAADTADYELRVGNLRVLYRVEETDDQRRVIAAIIGEKHRNKLIVEGEEFTI